jgi:hypothetical protein
MRKKGRKVLFALLVDEACLPRLDRITHAYSAKVPGSRLTRSDAGRAAIHVGLDTIERDLGLAGNDGYRATVERTAHDGPSEGGASP